jgi:Tol biopolymer transport system component
MRRRRVFVVAATGLLAGALVGCQPAPTTSWDLSLVSHRPDGAAADARTLDSHFSPDGTRVVFTTSASDLGPTDGNGTDDVYVRDLSTGAITLVSANATRTDGGNALSDLGRFGADGHRVIFRSDATDLVPTTGILTSQWYAYDLATGETVLVTAGATGGGATRDGDVADTGLPDVSRDGTKVVFATNADNLGPTDTDGEFDVYLRDLAAGTNTLITVGDGGAFNPAFTPDGHTVVYIDGSDVDPRDTNGEGDIYAYDVTTGATRLLTLDVTGAHAPDGPSITGPDFSPDGRLLAFISSAPDLVPTDTNRRFDLFVLDMASGAISLVSANAAGTDSGAGDSFLNTEDSHFSADGTRIAFTSTAPDLTPLRDDNAESDAFVRDLVAGTTTLVSTDPAGTRPVGGITAVLSSDGTLAAFSTVTMVPGTVDSNHDVDIYVRDLAGGTTSLVTANAARTDGAGGVSSAMSFSPTGSQLLFDSDGTDMGPPDANGQFDTYIATLRRADLVLTLGATPPRATPGGTVTYTVDVSNRGDDASGTTVLLGVSDGAGGLGASTTNGSCADGAESNVIACVLGTLPAGAHARIIATAHVTAPPGSTLTGGALVSTSTAELHLDDNVAVVETPVVG